MNRSKNRKPHKNHPPDLPLRVTPFPYRGLGSRISVIVKTFNRPQSCTRCIQCLQSAFPDIHIFIGDDSKIPLNYNNKHVTVVHLPFDSGTSIGRNVILRKVRTPYFLCIDDDMMVSSGTNLPALVELLDTHKDIDGIGGFCSVGEQAKIAGHISKEGDRLYHTFGQSWGYSKKGLPLYSYILQIIVGRTASFKTCEWRAELKLSEHSEHFLRAFKQGFKITFCPLLHVIHQHNYKGERNKPRYAKFRTRGRMYQDKEANVLKIRYVLNDVFATASEQQRMRNCISHLKKPYLAKKAVLAAERMFKTFRKERGPPKYTITYRKK